MRFTVLAAAVLALPAAAQPVPTSFTLSSGYATGFEAGGIHAEGRLRYAPAGKLGLEPMASWTKELPHLVAYDVGVDPGEGSCVLREGPAASPGSTCTWRGGGDQAFAVGTALTYRAESDGLPLGLDGAHAGVFGQVVLPLWWSRGHRLGVEAGVDVRLSSRVRLGADVQVSRFTDFPDAPGLTVSPLVRLGVGR